MDRRYPPRPWVGVGVIIVRDGRVLLVQRGRQPGRGLWALPGGMVDLGETMRQAAAREALEETGLRVEVGDVYWVADGIVRDETGRVEYHNAIVDFLATAPDGEPAGADDAMDVRWVGPDDVEEMALTPSMWPLIEKLFGRSYRRA
ncbi:MAG TPA: NUDIX hydrolase [Chloroflexota bacterium]|nr:NUDIX hydrolase [Chloroflexota bacterium]